MVSVNLVSLLNLFDILYGVIYRFFHPFQNEVLLLGVLGKILIKKFDRRQLEVVEMVHGKQNEYLSECKWSIEF